MAIIFANLKFKKYFYEEKTIYIKIYQYKLKHIKKYILIY